MQDYADICVSDVDGGHAVNNKAGEGIGDFGG